MTNTSRNNFNDSHLMQSEIAAIDAMYEIVDAEFNSRSDIHAMWNNLATRHEEFRGLFAQHLRWEVEKVSQREGLFVSRYSVEQVCKRIAEDWWRTYDNVNARTS